MRRRSRRRLVDEVVVSRQPIASTAQLGRVAGARDVAVRFGGAEGGGVGAAQGIAAVAFAAVLGAKVVVL